MIIKRVCHHYSKWEDWKAGMWRRISKIEREKMLPAAINFTGDHKLYGQYMVEVTEKWKIACEHNLTDFSINQKAWIGHAACCLAIHCPEIVTRMAWWHLSEEQRVRANKMAVKAIKFWRSSYFKNGIQRGLF